MPNVSQPDERYLLDAIKFSRRMGNYLYLPLFLVSGFCLGVMVSFVAGEKSWRTQEQRILFYIFAVATLAAAILWLLSRRPRASLLLAQSILFAVLTLVWVGWFLWNIGFNFANFWRQGLSRLDWFFFVALGIGAASIKCLRLSRSLRSVDDVMLGRLLERLKILSGLDDTSQ